MNFKGVQRRFNKIFTFNNKTREKKNLLVFLKPIILNNRVQ